MHLLKACLPGTSDGQRRGKQGEGGPDGRTKWAFLMGRPWVLKWKVVKAREKPRSQVEIFKTRRRARCPSSHRRLCDLCYLSHAETGIVDINDI